MRKLCNVENIIQMNVVISSVVDEKIVNMHVLIRYHIGLRFSFLFSSIYIRRKYWIRENFQLPVFDGFTCFEMS